MFFNLLRLRGHKFVRLNVCGLAFKDHQLLHVNHDIVDVLPVRTKATALGLVQLIELKLLNNTLFAKPVVAHLHAHGQS